MEIEIFNIKTALTKELLTNENNLNELLNKIEDLGNLVFDFSTKDKAKEAKNLKTQANKFSEELKEFCKPLEAEGKKIADARSAITTKLVSGKDNVIDKILKPISEAEDKLKNLKAKNNTPITDLHSVSVVLDYCQEIESFNWLYLHEEAQSEIKKLKGHALLTKQTLETEQKTKLEAETKLRIEREAKIAAEAAENAKIAAENAAKKAIADAELKAKQAEEAAKRAQENKRLEIEAAIAKEKNRAEAEQKLEEQAAAKRESDKFHRIKINNEILQDIVNCDPLEPLEIDICKKIILAIANGEVRHVSIKY